MLMKGNDINWYYFTDKKYIPDLIKLISNKKIIIVDTETYPNKIYGDKSSALDPHTGLCRLIQINYPNNKIPIIIDVLKIGAENLIPFVEELAKLDKLKLGHNFRFDLKIFKANFGIWLQNCHCSMVAMQTLGISTGYKASILRGHSLKSLARDLFDCDLSKVESTSDWSRQDLTMEQLEYSALDVGAPKQLGIDSIVLQGYLMIKEALINEYKEQTAFEIDQEAMYVCARCEYAGMYINTEWLDLLTIKANYEMETSRLKLCEALGFPLEQQLVYDEESKSFIHQTIVSDRISKLLNNNKDLVNYINLVLAKTNNKKLTSLQASELETKLKEIETDRDLDEEDLEGSLSIELREEQERLYDYGIDMVKHLLNYKKFNKLLSECKKYKEIINPVTNRVHAGLNAIGAATSRLSSSGDLNLQQISTLNVDFEISGDMISKW